MKKGIFLTAIIVLLIAGWSAGWFYVAERVEGEVAKAKTKLETAGGQAECLNQATTGYPFRITLSCDAILIEKEGNAFSARGLKSVAQAYQPNHILVEATSPGQITQANYPPLYLEWSSMRSNLKAGIKKLNAISFQARDLTIKPKNNSQSMQVADLQYHEREEGDNNLDLAVALLGAKDVVLEPLGNFSFDLRSEITIDNAHDDFSKNRDLIMLAKTEGLNTQIHRIHFVMAKGGGVKISGPATFSTQGMLTAKLSIEIAELDKLLALAKEKNPRLTREINQAGQAIKLLSKPNENDVRKFNFTISDNLLKLGLIPMGRLPRLY